MAVESRRQESVYVGVEPRTSRSMLDGCGIETRSSHERPLRGSGVAIDARWLWNRDCKRLEQAKQLLAVAIDARWLWNRDNDGADAARSS